MQRNRHILFVLVFAVSALPLFAQATTGPSPTRESIWVARLFFIAVNQGNEADARGLFAEDATVVDRGNRHTGGDIDGWLAGSVFEPDVALNVQDDCVEERTVIADVEWTPSGEDTTRLRLRFLRTETGLIERLVLRRAEGPLECRE